MMKYLACGNDGLFIQIMKTQIDVIDETLTGIERLEGFADHYACGDRDEFTAFPTFLDIDASFVP